VSIIETTKLFDRLLAVFPHPDDETFACGGTFAALSERGVAVTLVCATRGEVGEIRVPGLATPETLGQVREGELRRAMDELGVADVRLLDYRDSGMVGTPANDDPRALMQASEREVAARIASALEEVRPDVVVTYGPDGIYGHPDHLTVHLATTAAVLATGDSTGAWRPRAFYYATVPRERFLALAATPNTRFSEMPAEELARWGVPLAEITTFVDVAPYIERKRAAMEAHQTQFGDGGPLSEFPQDEVDRLLGREHFLRVALPWDDSVSPFDPLPLLSVTSLR
jgi:N-acetyl-1-D-myo-inositol-2-amino-2-deoxy-alpha-D-glucopyranoside deacetylase